jgi:hypothetical protein
VGSAVGQLNKHCAPLVLWWVAGAWDVTWAVRPRWSILGENSSDNKTMHEPQLIPFYSLGCWF